jgi:L-cystine uptake protein TcyP (sodium:dicarboxylate symporter family)
MDYNVLFHMILFRLSLIICLLSNFLKISNKLLMKKFSILILSFLLIYSIKDQVIDSIIDIRNGQVYKVVKIGQQWWMQENLNIGTMIDSTQNAADNEIIEKYCYRNSRLIIEAHNFLATLHY